jgi:hypothetical protein
MQYMTVVCFFGRAIRMRSAIMYAEPSDLLNWTVINGINHPIASIDTVTGVTDR